jgi:hypothetical protein
MTYFRIGQLGTSKTPAFEGETALKAFQPLVDFSTRQDRASLVDAASAPARPPRSQTKTLFPTVKTASSAGRRRRRSRTTRVRIVRGKVALRVQGYPKIQHLGASQLVRFVPLNKLRSAAKRVLGRHPRRKGRRRVSKQRRRRSHRAVRRQRRRRRRRVRRRRTN